MNDLDLEEIESHLYSQIYHSNEDNDQIPAPSEIFLKPDTDMRKPNRYFRSNPRSGGAKFQNKHVLVNQHNLKPPLHSDYYPQQQGIYSKSYERPQKRDISINQLVVLAPQPPIVCVSKSAKKKALRAAKWKKFKEKRRKQKLEQSPSDNSKFKSKNIKKEPCDVITVSDSEEESCIELPNNWPVVSVIDSDDENKSAPKAEKVIKSDEPRHSLTDDVIFVEPVNAPAEVINLDEETEKNSDVSIDTASVTSSTNSFLNNYSPSKSKSVKDLNRERKELLCTPDSTSNDFITGSGSVDLNQSSFNFSLHGRDFNNDKFLKPANPTENCETESSSSTTDLNTMKTAVFSEIEFPKEDMFSEANLESFGNLITPNRKRLAKDTIRASTPVENLPVGQDQNLYSSDSSSESDFEDALDKQKELLKTSKNLPNLSPMLAEMRSSPQPVPKKKSKKTNISSKYELIEAIPKKKQKKRKSNQSQEALEQNSSKKKNKSKKRKTDDTNTNSPQVESTTEPNSTAVLENQGEVTFDQTTDSETRRKNRKSSSFLDDSSENLDAKKRKTKKKKSFFAAESEDVESSSSQVDFTPVEEQAKAADASPENLDQSQSKKKAKNKKKKNLSGAESEDNVVTDAESIIPPQQETQVASVSVRETEKTLPCNSTDVTNEKTHEETNQNHEINPNVSIKTEECVTNSETCDPTNADLMKLETAAAKVVVTTETEELSEDVTKELEGFVVIDEAKNEDSLVVISSDSDSNLSALVGQQDIQLNLETPVTQDKHVSLPLLPTPEVNLADNTLEEVQRTMSNDPNLWTILDSDRMPSRSNNGGRRCNRCRERGHMAIRCPNKVVPKCNLCGESGHYEPRCPNRVCTQCGERSPYSTTYCKLCFRFRKWKCPICFMMGHKAESCPDLWRRYHLTTTDGPLKNHEGPTLKPRQQLWCSGCARSGHLEYACRFFQSVYPPTDPSIKSYLNVYENGREHGQQMQYLGQPLMPYGVDQFSGRKYLLPTPPAMPQNPPVMYNQSSYPVNQYPRQACPENRDFRNNQGNMFPPRQNGPIHDIQGYPSNNPQGYYEFHFDDNLPNFISFETPSSSVNVNYGNFHPRDRYFDNSRAPERLNDFSIDQPPQQPNQNLDFEETGNSSVPNTTAGQKKQNMLVFFSSSSSTIQHFVTTELGKLIKLSQQMKSIVSNLKKQMYQPVGNIQKYYKTMNMVLFGIFKMNEGEKHLVKLKNFRLEPKTIKLNQQRRKDLYRSYCYIFGNKKHVDVNYNKLLKRI